VEKVFDKNFFLVKLITNWLIIFSIIYIINLSYNRSQYVKYDTLLDICLYVLLNYWVVLVHDFYFSDNNWVFCLIIVNGYSHFLRGFYKFFSQLFYRLYIIISLESDVVHIHWSPIVVRTKAIPLNLLIYRTIFFNTRLNNTKDSTSFSSSHGVMLNFLFLSMYNVTYYFHGNLNCISILIKLCLKMC